MSEGTRTGFSSSGDSGTRATARIQVRMSSGKIYGPYQRHEILKFIDQKKIRGEEQILVEGEFQWKPISADLEFFDAIQDVLAGRLRRTLKPNQGTQATRVSGHNRSDGDMASASEESGQGYADPKLAQKEQGRLPEPVFLPPESPQAAGASDDLVVETPIKDRSRHSDKPKGMSPAWLSLAAGLVVLVVGVYVLGPTKPTAPKAVKKANSQALYARPLLLAMGDLKVPSVEMPGTLQPGGIVLWGESFHALAWATQWRRLDSAPIEESQKASYWKSRAWLAMALGTAVTAIDETSGRDWFFWGRAVVSSLKQRGVLSAEEENLFSSLEFLASGDWAKAKDALAKAPNLEMAQWLLEEVAWQEYWIAGAKGNPVSRLKDSYSISSFELVSQLRVSLFAQDESFGDWSLQLAALDPVSTPLWFANAQKFWRLSRDGVAGADRMFKVALGTASLLPVSFQRTVWIQYSEFLRTFGRAALSEKAARNAALLGQGDVNKGDEWWDLSQPGLELPAMVQSVLSSDRKKALSAVDIALLEALGALAPESASSVSVAGYSLAFSGAMNRAIRLFEDVLRVDPKNLSALHGLLWARSARHEFDKAFELQSQIVTASRNGTEANRALAVIRYFGREYEGAAEDFVNYLKAEPQDAWGHYFLALTYLAMNKPLDCVRSANLGSANGSGELVLRSRLLFFRCRFIAGATVEQALNELKEWIEKEPSVAPIRVELMRGMSQIELKQDAIQFGRDSLTRFPRSYELRMALAEAYESAEQYSEAVAFYNSAKQDRPDSAEAFVRIGAIQMKMRQYADAAQSFAGAGFLEPEFPEVWLFAARAARLARQTADAATYFFREVEARPSVVGTFLEAAEFFLEANAPQEVLKLFSKFTADFQDDPRVQTRLAQAHFALGEVDKAKQAAGTALSADVQNPQAQLLMGWIYDKEAQYSLAKEHFEAYLKLLPQANDVPSLRQKLSQPPYAGL